MTLSLLAAAVGTPENPNGTTMPLPPTPWLYSYAYPANCLAMRFLVPSAPGTATGVPPTSATIAAPVYIPGGGKIPYAVAYGTDSGNNPITVILTNQSQAQAVYTVDQPNPVNWDSQFQAAMVASLAAYLVPALSLNLALVQICVKSAQEMIMRARVSDGNEGFVSQDHVPDFIRARNVGGGPAAFVAGYGWNGAAYGAYTDMCW